MGNNGTKRTCPFRPFRTRGSCSALEAGVNGLIDEIPTRLCPKCGIQYLRPLIQIPNLDMLVILCPHCGASIEAFKSRKNLDDVIDRALSLVEHAYLRGAERCK
jgi:predicted RNA-binding Zn-ribbon protein involved in translation (DUF1610 family)